MSSSSSMAALLSVPTYHHHPHHHITSLNFPLRKSSSQFPCLASSSSSPSTDEMIPQSDEPSFPPGSCEGCGKAEKERGCNGEGRIQGGIATVPGFGWWPIKAYRPCPGFVESGGRYKRFGQSMDDVVSGRGRRRRPVAVESDDVDASSSSGKKPSPRKFTR